MVIRSSDNLEVTADSYQWNTEDCYTNRAYNNGNPQCFPNGKTTATITGEDLKAEDAGTINCIARIDTTDYESNSITIRIAG